MRVASLFDGHSCARVALKRAGLRVTYYAAWEIDPDAILVSQWNHDDIHHHGSVVNADFSGWWDLICGGSPCQGFSFAGKQLNFDDPRSKLFFEFVRAVDEARKVNPDVYFLLENVVMKQEYQDIISYYLGVQPIKINSSLVSAQNRNRLYWTNIPHVDQPEDRGVFLKDILQTGGSDLVLSGGWLKWWNENKDFQLRKRYSALDPEKAICLTARGYGSWNGNFITTPFGVRKLSPVECERLQTLPDDYTWIVPSTQRYKQLGNGWTVDVIAHILNGINIAQLI